MIRGWITLLDLISQPVRLGQLTAQLIELFEPPAWTGQIALNFTIEGEDNACMMDTDKWGKIVYNLLANALKFTPAGGKVNVRLNVETDPIQLLVNDTGLGIAPDKLPFIFDRFYQVDDPLTRSFEGLGVGLALVGELTHMLGGHVTVTSQLGAGRLTLPWQPAPPDADPVAATAPRSVAVQPLLSHSFSQLTKSTISPEDGRALVLIVEDNAKLRAFMVEELSDCYQVLTADNEEIGWEVIRQHLPDMVISDVMMPRMDGFQLANLIKSTPATDHIAVVLLTARSTQESRVEGLGQRVDEYLVKPFDLVELRLRLANIITRRQTLQHYCRQQIEQPNEQRSNGSQLPADPFWSEFTSC